ncbi:MAG: AAA family ATPase [Polyangiales bacterium]
MDGDDLAMGSAEGPSSDGAALDRGSLRAAIGAAIDDVHRGLVARRDAARWLVLALVAGQPILLIGPPGTAKTTMARAAAAVVGAKCIESTVDALAPDAVLFDRAALDEAGAVFVVDDALEARGASLRAVKSLLDRRPSALVATSLTVDGADPVLLDRFVFRVEVDPLPAHAFAALLAERSEPEGPREPKLSWALIERVRRESAGVALSSWVIEALQQLRAATNEAGVARSDRWWLAVTSVLRVVAYCEGEDSVTLAPLRTLAGMFSSDGPRGAEVASRWVSAGVRATFSARTERIFTALRALSAALDEDNAVRVQKLDRAGTPLFRTPNGDVTTAATRTVEHRTAVGERLFKRPTGTINPGSREAYTASELYTHFFVGRVSELRQYTENPASVATIEEPNEPITEQRALESSHIDARIEWLATIALDLRDLRVECKRLLESNAQGVWSETSESDRGFASDLLAAVEPAVAMVSALRGRIAALPVAES